MLNGLLKKIFGTSNERYLKGLQSTVEYINSLEDSISKLSDNDLKNKTSEFKSLVANGKTLDELLPEAFACVREAAKRVLGQRHYDVQLIGGIVLHQGKIAEMKTGEGKTLVSTLAAYLNALSGKGVHVVTVNDYLAQRDSEWMGKIFSFLGLTTGCILHGQLPPEKRQQYNCDITYGTNSEFGFDYLRDNMKFELNQMFQRPFNFAIVDEVDSILVDEARTPLIISGPVEDRTDLYIKINKYIPKLEASHYEIDEKAHSVILTEEGNQFIEELYCSEGVIREGSTLYDVENITVQHHTNQALKAHKLFVKNKDYLVKEGAVYIIDEFTGRIMEGRRYSDGLHQALEAKENVKIQNENQTLASITYQNYFRMYPKLSGMTGTAMTEAAEFSEIYNLEVIEIPTHRPIQRKDEDDNIYRTEEEKFEAIARLIKSCNEKKQPVLAGTASVEKSEMLSKYLKKQGIKHSILNAKQHEREALIIAQAGRPGSVTVATNMAGRGTDIQLGGNFELLMKDAAQGITDERYLKDLEEKIKAQIIEDKKTVLEAGGLCVVGTERHESRRIDNQLRGRSGRQGDPGFSKFYLSAEDDLIRVFGADKKMNWILEKMGTPGEPIEHPMITRIMEKAQGKVEARNFDIRKNLLKFDDVMNDQRKIIYRERINIMNAADVRDKIEQYLDEQIDELVSAYIPENSYVESWQTKTLANEVYRIFGLQLNIEDWAKEDGITDNEIYDKILEAAKAVLSKRDEAYNKEQMTGLEKRILLFTLDEVWKDHLHFLDQLRTGINLRAYAQKDPLNEYKSEAFGAFKDMLVLLTEKYLTRIFHIHITQDEDMIEIMSEKMMERQKQTFEGNFDPAAGFNPGAEKQPQVTIRTNIDPKDRDPRNPATWGKIARNEACPCGSGKKYKQCHGKIEP
ncbi:MAG TPA: preprotein translocase subunit SecA [Alphaproteobacteria bacterium]|nr:preprotein translocase subunit SecA [Alphaproteobacteria bacterium]